MRAACPPSSASPGGQAGASTGWGHSIPGCLLTASVLTPGCFAGGQTESTFMSSHFGFLAACTGRRLQNVTVAFSAFLLGLLGQGGHA